MRSMNTLTRADLAEAINRKLGLSRSESLAMVESILAHMAQALETGRTSRSPASAPSCCATRPQRIGRNPKTGVEVPITPRRVLTFRASQMLKDRIAKG